MVPRPPTELNVTGIITHKVADDGTKVSLTFSTRYSGDLILTMPVECAGDLIESLGRSNLATSPARDISDVAQSRLPAPGPSSAGAAPKAADKGQATIRITTPKKWMVTSNTQIPGGFVVLLFDPQTAAQAGYALKAESAKEMSAAILKQVEMVLAKNSDT